MKNNPLIVALDVETFDEARKLVDELDNVEIFKIGSQLFTECGPVIVRYVLAKGKNVFLDLKYHDIPNTVANAVKSAVGLGQVVCESQKSIFMCTVHTVGGREMLEAASHAAKTRAQQLNVTKPLIVGITVLTSDQKSDNIENLVVERAILAKEAGLDGVVASSQEAKIIREKLGKDFIIVTPGIRPSGADKQDQKRVTTPGEAVKNGSDFLVVGRPIIKAENPRLAVKQILEEIEKARHRP